MKNKLSFVFILSFLLLFNLQPFAQGVAIEDCLTRSRQECERLFA